MPNQRIINPSSRSIPMVGILQVGSKNHFRLVESWVSLLELSQKGITLFLDEESAELIKPRPQTDRIVKAKGESYRSFFCRINARVSKLDLLIICSLQDFYLEFLFWNPRVKSAITIHNARTWLVTHKRTPKEMLKHVVRQKWLRRSSYVIVNSSNMEQYIQTYAKKLVKPVRIMPFHLNVTTCPAANRALNQSLVICIPGIVTKARRNYTDIFQVIRRLGAGYRLVLLGSPSAKEGGEEILREARRLNLACGCDITYFENFVSPDEYDATLTNADIVFADLKLGYERYGFSEVYGQTKDSGVSYAMITHEKPGLFKAGFRNLSDLESSTLYYDGVEDLEHKLRELRSAPQRLQKLKEEAKLNAQKFRPERILQQLEFLNA